MSPCRSLDGGCARKLATRHETTNADRGEGEVVVPRLEVADGAARACFFDGVV